jgi:hypothetical protein
MSVDVSIEGNGGNRAKVSEYGELVTAPVSYSTPSVGSLVANDTGVMFIPPQVGKRIVITGVIVAAGKNVSATTAAAVEVYESSTGSGETVAQSILQTEILKSETQSFLPLNVITSEGRWVMAKTSDADVNVSIYYYYIGE